MITQITPITDWIQAMGFELVRSHHLENRVINYYNLGNFGVYEEIQTTADEPQSLESEHARYIYWNLWGDKFEAQSVLELTEAYEETVSINPELFS